MFGLYGARRVKKLVSRLREEYEEVLRGQREAYAELKEENRALRARLLKLEEERGGVADAMLLAAREGERVRAEKEAELESDLGELRLLIEKCRLLSARLTEKYPDEEDVAAFSAFLGELRARLGEQPEETVFDMEEVLSPKGPLDLGKLCKELGVMEDDV